jgi:exosortase/archaeosortase family protein
MLEVSLTNSRDGSLPSSKISRFWGLEVSRTLLLALAFTLVAVVADQFAAPILETPSPLWATAACLLLVWRRGNPPLLLAETPVGRGLSLARLAAFIAAHLIVILAARSMTGALEPVVGTATFWGVLVAACKLSVLAPTLLLLPLPLWSQFVTAYRPEGKAVLVALLTHVPRRAVEALWPWYGQVLGRFVYALARPFVPGLGYQSDLNPNLAGPDLDITIELPCSGISGLELFGLLFGLVVFLDWNRLRKRRALLVYLLGLFAMLVGNALRITSLVIVGNRGFVNFISQFHVSAGWIFFSAIFLVYLSLTYGWMLDKKSAAAERKPAI